MREISQIAVFSTVSKPPRAIIARLASRRTKARIMSIRKRLRSLGRQRTEEEPSDETEVEAEPSEPDPDFPYPVYISDDLTQKTAKLAQKWRQLKREKKISDTWVFEGRVLAKDLHQHVHEIKNEEIINWII